MRSRPSARSRIIESDSDNDFQEFQAGPSISKVQKEEEDTLETEEESIGDKSGKNKIKQGTILSVYSL